MKKNKTPQIHMVYGTIKNKKGELIPNLLVRTYNDNPKSNSVLLGTAVSNAKGKYNIAYPAALLGNKSSAKSNTYLVVKVFTPDGKELHKSALVTKAGIKHRIDVNDLEYPDEEKIPDTFYTIKGMVVTDKGEAIPNSIIEVFDKAMPGNAEALINMSSPVLSKEDGSYEIKIPYSKVRETGKTNPDIVLKVSDDKNNIIHEATKFNSSANEEINLTVAKEKYKVRAEMSVLNDAIQKNLGNRTSKNDVKENDNERGITYLSQKTKWDARLVAMNILATKMSDASENAMPETFYYSLFRSGVSSKKSEIYRLPADKAMTLYNDAIDANVIEKGKNPKRQLREKFVEESVDYLLGSKDAGAVSTADEMLALALENSSDRKTFMKLYYHEINDKTKVWEAVTKELGEDKSNALQLDGKLGFLTFNNAPLIDRLKKDRAITSSPLDLVKSGYYNSADKKWASIVDENEVPSIFKGDSPAKKKENYIHWMTTQLELSYPTAITAEMIKNEEIDIGAEPVVREEVYDALYQNEKGFELGAYSINKHIEELSQEGIVVSDKAKVELKRLHRVNQLAPSRNDVNMMIKMNLDSAFKIVRYDKDHFVQRFKMDFGDDELKVQALYDKAATDAALITNLSMSYLTQSVNSLPAALAPMVTNSPAASVKKYPTLEGLFGSLDYCSCGHCESVLSPAAYFVDLLQFLDLSDDDIPGPLDKLLERRPDLEHIELTCKNTNTLLPNIDVANEIMSHWVIKNNENHPNENIDEIMKGFKGHNTDENITSAELLANPQYVNDLAYQELKNKVYPFNLPFDRDLELCRAYFKELDLSLYESMELFRKDDSYHKAKPEYGWREIFSEQLGLSNREFEILSDSNSNTFTIHDLYGLTTGTILNNELSNAKLFSQKVDISYAEIIELLKTEFINPNVWLLPRLEILLSAFSKGKESNLDVKSNYGDKSLFEIIHDFINDTANTKADFNKIFPQTEYNYDLFDNNLKGWLGKNHKAIMSIMMLTPSDLIAKLEILDNAFVAGLNAKPVMKKRYGDDTIHSFIAKFVNSKVSLKDLNKIFTKWNYNKADFGSNLYSWLRANYNALSVLDPGKECDFGNLQIKYSHPTNADLSDVEYWKLLRFIRFSKKMGWSILETDKVIKSLTNLGAEIELVEPDNKLNVLDKGFEDLLVKVALMQRIKAALKIKGKGSLDKLLALLSNIGTLGNNSLYKRMFLNTTILPLVAGTNPFEQNTDGSYLTDRTKILFDFKPALLSAFNLADEEWELIIKFLGFDATTKLLLKEVSSVFKYTFLAKSLKIKVADLINLIDISGLRPFESFTYKKNGNPVQCIEPDLLQLINVIKTIEPTRFKIQDIIYIFQHTDPFDKGSPKEEDVLSVMKLIHQGLKDIENEYPIQGLVSDTKGIALLTAFYGAEAANTIHAIFNTPKIFTVEYDHWDEFLDDTIKEASSRLSYDNLTKELSFQGKIYSDLIFFYFRFISAPDNKARLKFLEALKGLYRQGEEEYGSFFSKFPDFKKYNNGQHTFNSVVSSALSPYVIQLKKSFVINSISELLNVDNLLIETCLDKSLNTRNHYILDARYKKREPIITDYLILSKNGITASYYNGDDFTGLLIARNDIIPNLKYDGINAKLPKNTNDAGQNISAKWSFNVEVLTTSNYNFYLDVVNTANVKLRLDGEVIDLQFDIENQNWSNHSTINFEASKFYTVEIEATKIKDKAVLRWQQRDSFVEVIPQVQLFPKSIVDNFLISYSKTIKVLKWIEVLQLQAEEVEYFSNQADFFFDESRIGFLNEIPVKNWNSNNRSKWLFKRVLDIVQYLQIKEIAKIGNNELIRFLKNSSNVNENGESILYDIVDWKKSEVNVLTQYFSDQIEEHNLADRSLLWRVAKAIDKISEIKINASSFIEWSTPNPSPLVNSNIEAKLRSKYEESKWLDVVRPINDRLRDQQRGALASYVISCMKQNPETKHIDTSNKLFEYFLIDVEMDPCMKTSRLKQAISTVQLFVYRCLMNLENGVNPASISAKQWEWMNRYRVWEANRKVFLHPENFLDPSLRDTKSPLFKEFEAELLQSDINDDLATSALMNYLEKLDQIARLKICGICKGEGKEYHVVGRTHGANRHFYHRTYDGTWSAWEKINLDISEEPVIPVYWKGRLFLFWTLVVQKGQEENQIQSTSNDANSFNGPAKRIIEISLCWSEFYNGKWQAKRTSDFNDPVSFEDIKDFNNKALNLHSLIEHEELKILVHYNTYAYEPREKFVFFVFYNKHGQPKKEYTYFFEDKFDKWMELSNDSKRYIFNKHKGGFNINFYNSKLSKSVLEIILFNEFNNIIDISHPFPNIFNEPFICEDHRHQFFVKLKKHSKFIRTYTGFGEPIDFENYSANSISSNSKDAISEITDDQSNLGILRINETAGSNSKFRIFPERILISRSVFAFEGAEINISGSNTEQPKI